MPRPQIRRQTSVTRASRSKARLLDEPTRRDSWRSHVHCTYTAQRVQSFKLQTANVGVEGDSPRVLGVHGGLLLRGSPRERFRSRPCTLTTKGGALPLLLDYPPRSSDGAAMPRPHAVRRQTSVTRASQARLLDEPTRRDSWRSHVHCTYTAQRVQSFKLQTANVGVEGTPLALGARGPSHVREGPFDPPRERQGRFDLAPALLPSFLDYPPRSSDGAAMPRPHAVRRQTSVTRASRSKARLLDEPTRRDSWRSHVHCTYTAQRVQSFKLQTANVGGRGGLPSRSLGGPRGAFSHVREGPFDPPRERQGRFDLAPAPLTTKREGPCPSFLDYPPRSSDGAAMPRPHAVRRQTSVTRASRSKARLLDEPTRRDSWRSHVHCTYTAQRVQSFKLQTANVGVEGTPRVLLGSRGLLSRERRPFDPQENGRGVSISPLHP